MGIQILDEKDRPFYDESYITVTMSTNIKTWNSQNSRYDEEKIDYPMLNCSNEPIFDMSNTTNRDLFNFTFS